MVALKDITERKRMEEELRRHAEHLEELVAARTGELQESERRYRSLAENDPDIIQRFDRDLRRLYVNPAFEPATGVSAQAALGKTDRELELPEHLIPFWEQAVRTVFRTGERKIIGFEMPTPERRTDTMRPILCRNLPRTARRSMFSPSHATLRTACGWKKRCGKTRKDTGVSTTPSRTAFSSWGRMDGLRT